MREIRIVNTIFVDQGIFFSSFRLAEMPINSGRSMDFGISVYIGENLLKGMCRQYAVH